MFMVVDWFGSGPVEVGELQEQIQIKTNFSKNAAQIHT